jgi:hypothetical protein
MPKTLERRNNVSNNKRGNMVSIPMDQLNLKIIKDMISHADVKSVDMAKRYDTPLSTIQRRRTKLERMILKRRCYIDISHLGWRQADLLISVARGDCGITSTLTGKTIHFTDDEPDTVSTAAAALQKRLRTSLQRQNPSG